MNNAKRIIHYLRVYTFQCDLRMARLLVIGGCDLTPLWDWAASGVVQWLRHEQVAHVGWLKKVCVSQPAAPTDCLSDGNTGTV